VGRLADVTASLVALLASPELLIGLGIGLLASVTGWLVADRTAGTRQPIGPGLTAALVAVWLFNDGRAPMGVLVAVPLLAAAGLARRPIRSLESLAGTALLGSTVLALGIQGGLVFRLVVFFGVAGAVFVVSAAEATLDDRYPTATLLGASAVALVIGIPEIQRALLFAGSLIPFAVLGVGGRRLGAAGAAAYPALFVWIVAADSATAQGSVIGVIAALGFLAFGSLAPRLVAGRSPILITLAQTGWAVFASRVAGVRRGLVPALVIVIVGGGLALLLARSRLAGKIGSASTESWRPD
jgi:hypothetical protein